MKQWLRLGLLLAMGACACARGPKQVRPAPAWTGEKPMSWFDCAEGSTRVIRRTPGNGRPPFLQEERLVTSRDGKAEVALGRGSRQGFFDYPLRGRIEPVEKFLRRDRLEVEGEWIPVEVFEHITVLVGGHLERICGQRVEEVWKRVGAPAAEGALRVRHDRVHSDIPAWCSTPPVASRLSDAEGFVDTRRVLGVREEAVIDGWVYPCLRVRTWDHEGIPFDSLECPGVLGGKARWEQVLRSGDGQLQRDRLEVVSFDCRR